ncbi:MAG TPA: shikimate kinase [Defluviitaleaceae bacterium]|jgi:shikimate kinase|nr:shikimate kinase [Defluviitaleaceae bacterium]
MNNHLNIVLIGFMGCGKTTVGKNLSKKLSYPFVDSDLEIEKEIGMTISDYFKKYGENNFRLIEEKIIQKLASGKRKIIATGGGIVKNPGNIYHLKQNGLIIYLKASAEHIYNNLKNDFSRPLLNVEDKYTRIQSLLEERKSLYEKYSDYIVEVDGKAVDEITKSIIDYLEEGYRL